MPHVLVCACVMVLCCEVRSMHDHGCDTRVHCACVSPRAAAQHDHAAPVEAAPF
jgi:hypothetical protein